jgi:Tripartite tricarboxylate transporter family receptor
LTEYLRIVVGASISERLGQTFVIENKPGAGSNIATEVVVHAPPDGYSLLLVGGANAINATLYAKLNFSIMRQIDERSCAEVGGPDAIVPFETPRAIGHDLRSAIEDIPTIVSTVRVTLRHEVAGQLVACSRASDTR